MALGSTVASTMLNVLEPVPSFIFKMKCVRGDPLSSGVVHAIEIDVREAVVLVGASGLAGTAAAMIATSAVYGPVLIALTAATLNLKVSPAGLRLDRVNIVVIALTSPSS